MPFAEWGTVPSCMITGSPFSSRVGDRLQHAFDVSKIDCLTLERFFGWVLRTLGVDLIHLHYILCFLQCWIRRNCSLKPFWLAQNGAPAPDFFHHLAGVFLEMAPVAIGKLARFHIEETE